jgi:hypothetical protein
MMKTRSIFFMLMLCLGCAIHTSAQFRIGAEAGYLNSSYSISGFNRQPQHSFLVGAIASYTLHDIGWLESGLTFQQKGFRFDPYIIEEIPTSINDVRMKTYNLDMPLLIGLKFNVTNELSILPKAGGFFSYGLHGKAAFAGLTNEGEAFTTEYDPFSALYHLGATVDPPSVRIRYDRVDVGFQAGLDVMWKQYALRGAYKHALNQQYFFTDQMNCRTFSVSLGYYFW